VGDFLEGGDPQTPQTPTTVYASPSGLSTNTGTQQSPYDLNTALLSGNHIMMMDGIYTQDIVILRPGLTMQPVNGARPIVKKASGYPPSVQVLAGSTCTGIWFGGTRESAPNTAVQVGDGATISGCTFFGYYQCISEGGHVNCLYRNNRFVNCGGDGLWHSIYISGDSHARIYDNLFVGGQGYNIHLWHFEDHIDVQGNFCGGGFFEFVMQKIADQAIDNVFWNHVSADASPLTVNIGAGTFTHNLFGHKTMGTGKWDQDMNGNTGLTVDRLGLIGDAYVDTTTWPGHTYTIGPFVGDGHVLPAPGTNYTHYAVTDLPALLGYSEAEIDAAVAVLISTFGQTVQQIHDDQSIESNFAILRNVVDAWRLQ
jgi:hypothetical protein